MKKMVICSLLLILMASYTIAEKITFATGKVVWVMFDGSTQKSDKPTITRTFEIKGDYIYDSGINSYGGTFDTDVPFKIYARKQTTLLNDKLFGKFNMPLPQSWKNNFAYLFSSKQERILSAITIHTGTSPLADTLVLGETFYILSRPLINYDGFIIETGKRIVK